MNSTGNSISEIHGSQYLKMALRKTGEHLQTVETKLLHELEADFNYSFLEISVKEGSSPLVPSIKTCKIKLSLTGILEYSYSYAKDVFFQYYQGSYKIIKTPIVFICSIVSLVVTFVFHSLNTYALLQLNSQISSNFDVVPLNERFQKLDPDNAYVNGLISALSEPTIFRECLKQGYGPDIGKWDKFEERLPNNLKEEFRTWKASSLKEIKAGEAGSLEEIDEELNQGATEVGVPAFPPEGCEGNFRGFEKPLTYYVPRISVRQDMATKLSILHKEISRDNAKSEDPKLTQKMFLIRVNEDNERILHVEFDKIEVEFDKDQKPQKYYAYFKFDDPKFTIRQGEKFEFFYNKKKLDAAESKVRAEEEKSRKLWPIISEFKQATEQAMTVCKSFTNGGDLERVRGDAEKVLNLMNTLVDSCDKEGLSGIQTFEDAERELQAAKGELQSVLEIIKQKIKEDEGSSGH